MDEGCYYQAKEGDCISSIAEENGLFWETVWRHPNNAELRQVRQDPNVLYPRDRVFIPTPHEKIEEVQTEQRHRFRRKGVPAKARFRFLDEDGQPRGDVEYILDIDGELTQGHTDADGYIEVSIPPTARKGTITLREGESEETYAFSLGTMDPVSEESGARKRLNNLGYDCGVGQDDRFEEVLKEFQYNHDLEVSGKLDEATQKALLEAHGC